MRTLKDELNMLYRDLIPSYPGHDILADRAVQIFTDYLIEKLPISIVNAMKAMEVKDE